MQVFWPAVGLTLAAVFFAYVLDRLKRESRDVSSAWSLDQQRRGFSGGTENVSIAWPLNKVENESADRNRERLRR